MQRFLLFVMFGCALCTLSLQHVYMPFTVLQNDDCLVCAIGKQSQHSFRSPHRYRVYSRNADRLVYFMHTNTNTQRESATTTTKIDVKKTFTQLTYIRTHWAHKQHTCLKSNQNVIFYCFHFLRFPASSLSLVRLPSSICVRRCEFGFFFLLRFMPFFIQIGGRIFVPVRIRINFIVFRALQMNTRKAFSL